MQLCWLCGEKGQTGKQDLIFFKGKKLYRKTIFKNCINKQVTNTQLEVIIDQWYGDQTKWFTISNLEKNAYERGTNL